MRNTDKMTAMKASQGKTGGDDALDRDQPGPVSVSPEDQKKPSYTYNADKTDPVDPHLSDENKPHSDGGPSKTEAGEKVLERDQPGPVSVSPKGKDTPSYTHNADKTDPIDPHLADQSKHSK